MTQSRTVPPAVGEEFAGTPIHVTQATIDEYGELNGDNDIIHYDKAYAQARGFRDTIAHGLMSVSYLSEALRDEWGLGWILSGSLDIRWTAPVCPGDTVTPKGQITQVEDLADGDLAGEGFAVVDPRDITLALERPQGSAQNVLRGPIEEVEPEPPHGERVRVSVGSRPPVVAEVTRAAAERMGLRAGTEVYAVFKATGVRLFE